jgi:hypothetical protein
MASGHVSRIKRPDTWLHRPMLQNVKKALANPEPSTHGTLETYRSALTMSVSREDQKSPHDSQMPRMMWWTTPAPGIECAKGVIVEQRITGGGRPHAC